MTNEASTTTTVPTSSTTIQYKENNDSFAVSVSVNSNNTLSISALDKNSFVIYEKSDIKKKFAQQYYENLKKKNFSLTICQEGLSLIVAGIDEEVLSKASMVAEPEARILRLTATVQELQEALKDALQPAVLSLSSIKGQSNNVMHWDHERMPVDPEYFSISADKTIITVKKEGTYELYTKILGAYNSYISPYFAVNGEGALYLYGTASGGAHSDAAGLLIVKLNAGDEVSVRFQNGYATIYTHESAVHHTFSIKKISG